MIASNRLPVRLTGDDGGVPVLEPSAGGLVAALAGVADRSAWIGWPGGVVPAEAEPELRSRLAADGLHPVFLDRAEEANYYGRICNETLWPLFHDFDDRVHFGADAWRRYVAVNERFAAEIDACSPAGARVWIHDFHLLLVPAELRRRRPDLAIGFFLHTPFPAPAQLGLLPTGAEVVRGLLGADYAGFQTQSDATSFSAACGALLGFEPGPGAIGVEPAGIDCDRFRELLGRPETAELGEALEQRYRGRRLVLGVERLDYTKGIPQKLAAFERLLERAPTDAPPTVLLQVIVPSRLDSAASFAQRDEIDRAAARINERFGPAGHSALGGRAAGMGEPGPPPVECLHRSVSPAELAALYSRADVMAVTPLRDGMNLVAQEFVLCQGAAPRSAGRPPGVLLLSELAGAAQSLPGALLVDPRDSAAMAARLAEALELAPAERRRRLELLGDAVDRLDCHRWAERFLAGLEQAAAVPV